MFPMWKLIKRALLLLVTFAIHQSRICAPRAALAWTSTRRRRMRIPQQRLPLCGIVKFSWGFRQEACTVYRPRSLLFQQHQQDEEDTANNRKFPFPTIWVQDERQHENDDSLLPWDRFDATKKDCSNLTVIEVATRTYNWCANFVAPLELCPWTLGSLNAQGAIQIYIVDSTKNAESLAEKVVREASQQLQHDVTTGVVSPRVAIRFCVFVNKWQDFDSFYQWFIDFEDDLLDEAENNPMAIGNFVTIAPFHPSWLFENEDEALAFEKKSPYPTVSIVCTSEIDKAGPQATEKIGAHNVELLTKMGASKLERYYQEHVWVLSSQDEDKVRKD